MKGLYGVVLLCLVVSVMLNQASVSLAQTIYLAQTMDPLFRGLERGPKENTKGAETLTHETFKQESLTKEPSTHPSFLLRVKHKKRTNILLSAKYDVSKQAVFLPVSQLFKELAIYHQITESSDSPKGKGADDTDFIVMEGRYLKNGDLFRLDPARLHVRYGGRDYTLNNDELFQEDAEIYLLASRFEEIFGTDIEFIHSSLTLEIHMNEPFPYEEAGRRERLRRDVQKEWERFGSNSGLLKHQENDKYLQEGSYKKKFAGGGFMDYTINSTFQQNVKPASGQYSVRSGMELLGGDLQVDHSGGWSSASAVSRRRWNGKWAYQNPGGKWIRSVVAGHQSPKTGIGGQVIGLSWTNQRMHNNPFFAVEKLQGDTDPHAEVDVYLRDQLVQFGKANSSGAYSLPVRLMYGMNSYKIESLTDDGRTEIHERQIYVPVSQMRKGEFVYEIQTGQMKSSSSFIHRDSYMGYASARMGISHRQTLDTSVRWMQGGRIPYQWSGGWKMRLSDRSRLSAELVSGHLMRAGWTGSVSGGSNLALTVTKFDAASELNLQGATWVHEMQWSQAISLDFIHVGFQTHLERAQFSAYQRRTARFSASLQMGSTLWNGSYFAGRVCKLEGCRMQQNSWLLSGRYRFRGWGFSSLKAGPVMIQWTFSGDRHMSNLKRADLRISRRFPAFRIEAGGTWQVFSNQWMFRIAMQMRLGGKILSRSHAQWDTRQFQSSHHVSGSLGFDAASGKLFMLPGQQVGRAGLSVLMFHDKNNNQRFDEKSESLLSYPAVRLNEAASQFVGRDGILRFSGLTAHKTINLEIINSRLPDPYLRPVSNEMQVTLRQNQFYELQIPLYFGQWSEGRVFVQGEEKQLEPLQGLTLYLNRVDHDTPIFNGLNAKQMEDVLSNLNVSQLRKHLISSGSVQSFRDGSFFTHQLLPGTYLIEPDSAQLSYLGVSSEKRQMIHISADPLQPPPAPVRIVLVPHQRDRSNEFLSRESAVIRESDESEVIE